MDVPPDPGPFDYVKFSGLYRDVYLVTTAPVRITFNWEEMNAGVTFTTPSVDPVNKNATLDVKTQVHNETDTVTTLTVVNRVIDRDGMVVLKMANEQQVAPNSRTAFAQIGGIEENLRLWSTHDPYLYRLQTSVYSGGKLLDAVECKVGVRKFELHPREGFLLNGEPIELIGANRHQHFGYIGDAVPNSLHRKDMLQFKELGFNVVRTAHYPQDNSLVEACDELGILVYEEAPTWISIGNAAWFDNLEKAARTMVRNHRNHPSVVIWGGGINHRGYVPQVHLAVKQEDPTRLTASQSSRWTGWQTSGMTDIYGQMVYGPVEWYRHEPMLAMEGPESVELVAQNVLDPLQTGLIAWTAHDYYTFHPSEGRWPEKVRPGGLMTVFRHPYGITPWFPAERKAQPYLHIDSEWKPETKEVVVYSNAEEVGLYLNGKQIARQRPDKSGIYKGLQHPSFRFSIQRYEAGKLTAKGWAGGSVMAEKSVFTPRRASGIKLALDTVGRAFEADGGDILVGYAYVVDENGTVIKDNAQEISFSVKGPASIVGDGTTIGANPVKAANGHAPILIKAGTTAGKITLTASAKGLKNDKASFQSVPMHSQLAVTEPYTEVDVLQADIGGKDQLVQFGWTAWTGGDEEAVFQKSFPAFGGFDATISCASAEGVMKPLGEMNVMGKYGFAMGEGVMGIDPEGLVLRFDKLPKGSYTLTTYHHAPKPNTDSMDPNKDRLKSLNVLDIPYAKQISYTLRTARTSEKGAVTVSEGKVLPKSGAGCTYLSFTCDGNGPVEIRFEDANGEKGVWLNAFALKRFIP
ncbi:DUF4982 domain-containing protein [Pontibacter sp. E15-1]|uniref:glycoside hydrolase family 2 protein n=1 Tax=Pontibacter sp. E15-1 TaxID=2919918 RepID=UPI001F50062C|nr:glycoside hydrolase family 2 TIM barrel-domain containing protein [Pontibacter sp. E15-1]MCJ8163288.1 DUF4982 domain-containing protein [Pontibacter sp. E15-1]